MESKHFFQNMIKIVLPLSLGIILLWYLYRNQNIDEMMRIIKKGVRYDIILFSLIFGLLGNTIRGFRWSVLIDSLGKRISRANAVFAVLGNYAINMALPRVGEIWRCGVISKHEKISFTKLLGTLFVDRFMDTFVVGLLTLCLCVFNIGFFRNFFSENPPVFIDAIFRMTSSVWTYTGLGLALLVLLIWFVFVKLKHVSLVQKMVSIINNIMVGVKSLWKNKHKIRFFVQTVLIWCCYFLYFYITFFAFDFTKDLGVRIALIAFAMSSIGVAVPVQGGIGVWHFMVISTLVAFGVNKNDAGAFAMVVFAIQTVWIVFVGLLGIAAFPLINREKDVSGKNIVD